MLNAICLLQVIVGNIRQLVGHLNYYSSDWDDPAVKGGVIAFIVIFLLLIILVVAVVVWYKKFRHDGKQNISHLQIVSKHISEVYIIHD